MSHKILVGPSESMSKSKKNTIDPESIVNQYGADSVRLFILADSPPEKDVQWSDEGMVAYYKFLQKFWDLSQKTIEIINQKEGVYNSDLEKFTNHIVNKINLALEKFRYNIIIASFHEIYSFYREIIENKKNYPNLKKNFEKIIICMMPVIPHFASECLEKLNYKKEIFWPETNKDYLNNENINIVIQINGKKRNILSIKKDTEEEKIKTEINNQKLIHKYLERQQIIKTIYVKNKIINYIVK